MNFNSPRRIRSASRHTVLEAVCSAGASLVIAVSSWALLGAAPAGATTPGTPAASTQPAASAAGQGGATATTLLQDIESVTVTPTNTTPSDPDGGQWFYFSLKPGQSASSEAKITNPAPVAQTVTLGIADLLFSPNGTPSINHGPQTDVGSWAHFDEASVTVGPRQSVLVPFQVHAPNSAEPGDHFGVVTATSETESLPGSKSLRVVKVVAVRFYVTVPGIATKSFQIGRITPKLNSTLLPNYSLVSVPVDNTGRIRLDTKVTIGGVKAAGSAVILAKSTEIYTAKVPVPIYGGPVNENVVVKTNYSWLSKSVSHSQFVIPYGLLGILLALCLLIFGLYRLARARVRKSKRLRADLRRLEQMVLQRPGMAVSQPDVARHLDDEEDTDTMQPATTRTTPVRAEDKSAAVAAMETAIKRARRTGHLETLPELAVALHEAGGDALDALLESVPVANGRTPKIMNALADYPAERIQANPRLAKLSEPQRSRLISKGTGAVGEFSAGPRGNASRPKGPVTKPAGAAPATKTRGRATVATAAKPAAKAATPRTRKPNQPVG